MAKIVAFGEVLWDVFGKERRIGGAPFNFCGHLNQLGDQAILLTAVGRDQLGKETWDEAKNLGFPTEWLLDVDGPTGICQVVADAKGVPHYDLVKPAAYDEIALSAVQMDALQKENADLFYFGTLGQRSECSRKTLEKILERISFPQIFCDVNIRPPYIDAAVLDFSLAHCHIAKVSREEYRFLEMFGLVKCGQNTEILDAEKAIALAKAYPNLKMVILTRDKEGALVYDVSGNQIIPSSIPKSKLVSAVGAGDSFSACFVHYLLAGKKLKVCLECGICLSDYVVTQLGAIPKYPEWLRVALSEKSK